MPMMAPMTVADDPDIILPVMGDPAEISAHPFIEPAMLAKWILEKEEIWQERFMEPPEFARSCADRGIRADDQTIIRLWQLGLLRADLIVTTQRLRRAGLVPIGEIGENEHAYADSRPYKEYAAGLGSAASRLKPISPLTKLFFHPFRFCVVWQYEKLCRSALAPSALTSASDFRRLRKFFEQVQKRSGAARSISSFARANSIASLAVASEPYAYPRIFHRLRFRTDEATLRKDLAEHLAKLEKIYKNIGEKPIEEAWQLLCRSSSALDGNRELHEKLRLARSEIRERKLQGPLAGALFLKTTAEVLRRTAEHIFDTTWREEGETWDSANYKQRRYGTRRIFDGKGRVIDEVLREFWPDFGLHVRWYVEGDTEWGALDYFFGPNPSGIDLVNLHGQFGRPLLNHLKNDLKDGTYSFVSLDGDRPDNVRILRQAAKASNFFGQWYVSTPDFEFANFSLTELQEILWQMAEDEGARPASRATLIENTRAADCKAKLQKGARKLRELVRFSTNEAWGRRLMAFAETHPKNEKGEDRPIVSAAHDGLRGARGLFSHSADIRTLRVDPDTGRLVKK